MPESITVDLEVTKTKEIPKASFHAEGEFLHCKTYFQFSSIHKVKVRFIDALAQIDILNASVPGGQGFYLRPQTMGEFDTSGRIKQTTAEFDFFVRPPGGFKGQFEPRVYHPGNCSKITVTKVGSVKRTPSTDYSLYLLEIAQEMKEDSDSAYRQNRFGLAMHFARYSIEFASKSLFPSAGVQWPHNQHDVSEALRSRSVAKAYKSSKMSIEEIAWDLNLWANPPRLDLYGNPESFTEPFAIIPKEEVEMVRERAVKIILAAFDNFELNHLTTA